MTRGCEQPPVTCYTSDKSIGYTESYSVFPATRHGHTLSLQGVKRSDDLELEGCTDPHSVGIHQLLDYEGATVKAPQGYVGSNPGIPGIEFCY